MGYITFRIDDDPADLLTLPIQLNKFDDFDSQTSQTVSGITITKTENASGITYRFFGGLMSLEEFMDIILDIFPALYRVWDYDITNNSAFVNGHTYKLSGSVSNLYYSVNKEAISDHPDNSTISVKTQNNQSGGSSNYGYGCLSLIAFANSNQSDYRMGFFTYISDTITYNSTAYIYIDKLFTLNNAHLELDIDPGSKGFRPTAELMSKNVPGVGGRPSTSPTNKTPHYASDTVTQPGAPDESAASAVNSGFLHCYQMTQSELDKVASALYSDTLMDAIKNVFVNPLDFIASLMVFPCSPNVGSSEAIKFGKWACIATGATALGVSITGTKLSSQFKVVDFGSVTIDENWGNFLDYSQTTIELFLPFIGSVNIDVSECMGGTINVQYTIDFFTGQCVANVLCQRDLYIGANKSIANRAQHSYQGNCAIQIPLSAVNYGSMIGSLINASAQSITNPVSGFVGIAIDAVGGGFRPNVSSKGNIVANSGFCSVLYPYVRITRPITAEPDSYQEVVGYPSYINTTLGECEDLCICDDINLQGISGATENELNRIKQMCREGVYV